MNQTAQSIDLIRLSFMGIPLLMVMFIYLCWSLKVGSLLYATARMVSQLILIGYALIIIFKQSNPVITSGILALMLIAASWIALRPLQKLRKKYYLKTLLAISLGGVPTLALVTFIVVQLEPWYMPRYIIPLAGMIFANAMNCVSLCAERFHSEITQNKCTYAEARSRAYNASLLPLLNNFFAVGLVSLPGMMTGQILAGVSPLLAVRYQIMVMAMLLGSGGISAAIYLALIKNQNLKNLPATFF